MIPAQPNKGRISGDREKHEIAEKERLRDLILSGWHGSTKELRKKFGFSQNIVSAYYKNYLRRYRDKKEGVES